MVVDGRLGPDQAVHRARDRGQLEQPAGEGARRRTPRDSGVPYGTAGSPASRTPIACSFISVGHDGVQAQGTVGHEPRHLDGAEQAVVRCGMRLTSVVVVTLAPG